MEREVTLRIPKPELEELVHMRLALRQITGDILALSAAVGGLRDQLRDAQVAVDELGIRLEQSLQEAAAVERKRGRGMAHAKLEPQAVNKHQR